MNVTIVIDLTQKLKDECMVLYSLFIPISIKLQKSIITEIL